MNSGIISGSHGFDYVVDEVGRFGMTGGLSQSEALKLRLLAEEMLGLTVRLFDDDIIEYELYVENEDKNYVMFQTIISSIHLCRI